MNLANYTEADHDRALQRLADDIDAAMPDPAWIPPDPPGTVDLDGYCCCGGDVVESFDIEFGSADDCPLLRDNHGEPVDLGEPWGREGVAFGLCLLVIAVAVLLLVGAVL